MKCQFRNNATRLDQVSFKFKTSFVNLGPGVIQCSTQVMLFFEKK